MNLAANQPVVLMQDSLELAPHLPLLRDWDMAEGHVLAALWTNTQVIGERVVIAAEANNIDHCVITRLSMNVTPVERIDIRTNER